MGSALFGSAPKASFSTQPTISPPQQSILNTLSSILSDAFPYEQGGFRLGTTSLAALENQALQVGAGPTPQQQGAQDQSFDALSKALGYSAPQVSAPHIDATEAFRSGVVQPLTDDFLTRTLPAIAGVQGRSAGGTFGSGGAAARSTAATDLERVLAQTGSQFALSAAGANQQADLAASLANQTGGINAQKNVLAALGIAPSVSTMPETTLGAKIGLSSATFAPYQQMIADLIAGGTAGTQNTIGVGTGGSTGLLGGLFGGLGNFAGSSGGSALIASLFSDRRLKEDVEEVGSVDGFPLYKFRYKGTPERRLGFMAQDVEKRLPHAVGEVAGFKTVNYAAVLEDVLKEAA